MFLFFQTPSNTINIIQEADSFLHKIGQLALVYGPRILIGFLLIYIGFKVVNRFIKTMDKGLINSNFDKDLRPFLLGILSVIIKSVLVISAAGIMGIETTSFVAILAAMGFAVGLAFQGSLSNFVGGLLILFFKPFRTGDLIKVNEYRGRVREIQILYTVLETLERRCVIIPNSILSNGVVENITGAGIIRIDLVFAISYDENIDRARQVIMEVVGRCPYAI